MCFPTGETCVWWTGDYLRSSLWQSLDGERQIFTSVGDSLLSKRPPLQLRIKRSNGLWMFLTILPPIHVLFFVHCFSVSVFLSFVFASVYFVLALPSNEIRAGVWLILQILNAQTVSHPSCDGYNPDAHPYGHTGSSSLTGKGKVWSLVSIKDQWRLYI